MIAQDRIQGLTYAELANKYNVVKSTIHNVLHKSEIKTMVDGGTSQVISMIPRACKVLSGFLDDADNPTLKFKAAETVLKTGAIVPSNTINQTVNAVFNIQNNITLNAGVAKALNGSLLSDDPDTIDGECDEVA